MKHNTHQPVMEITVLSAQGLKNSAHFSQKIRPFITLTTSTPTNTPVADDECHVYETRVDDQGGINPTWGDKFLVPVDASFFGNRYSCINLQLYTKRLIMGRAQLGWCQIPAYDIVGFPSTGVVKYLSYRLRARDGTRTHGVVNVAVKLENLAPVSSEKVSINAITRTFDTCGTVIGTPVAQLPPLAGECSVTCQGQTSHFGFGDEVGLIRPYLLAASYEGIGPGWVSTLDFWESEKLNVNSMASVNVALVAMKANAMKI